MNTSTQLKALIRNLSKEKQVDAGILLRNYMLERLLEHIATNSTMIDLWKRYQRKFAYAEGIGWEEVIEAVRRFI